MLKEFAVSLHIVRPHRACRQRARERGASPAGRDIHCRGEAIVYQKKMRNFAGMIKSPYRRGADDGFLFGIYLTVMFFASIFAGSFAPLSLLALVMMVSVPVVIYRFMRSYHRSLGPSGTFAMLWMQGVMIFFLRHAHRRHRAGGVHEMDSSRLCGRAAHSRGRAQGLDARHTGGFAADVAARMLEARFIPAPIDIVTEMIMLAIVTGSLLSMTLSGIFALHRKHRV